MENILKQMIEFLFSGNDPNYWIISKFFLAFIGGIGAYLAKVNFFTKPGETKIKFWWTGFIFSLFGAIGGLCLLTPQTASNSFATGLIGVIAITSLIRQNNEGAEDGKYKDQKMNPEQIKKQYHE